jgi:putative zinc finger protein
MRAESCREWRESLGAYVLGQLPDDERIRLEAHLEGCPSCSAEIEQLSSLVRPMSLADPARFDTAPALPAALGARVATAIGRERLSRRRRRFSLGVALGGATAAVAAVLVLFVIGGSSPPGPEQHVSFASTPKGVKISAKLIPNAFGTEIHMYVKGVDSGTLCRVYLKSRGGGALSAGTFRYRWGDGSYPILSSALDLSKTEALEVKVGGRTYVAKLASSRSEGGSSQEERQ